MRRLPFPHWSSRRNSLVLILLAAAAFAAAPCGAQTAEELGTAERSSFAFPADGRDPFLPVGWEKPAEALPVENAPSAAAPALKAEMFVVSSISLDRIRLAVINGKPYGEGDTVPVEIAGKRGPKVQVLAIHDGSVTLISGTQRLECLLRIATGQQPPAKKP